MFHFKFKYLLVGIVGDIKKKKKVLQQLYMFMSSCIQYYQHK